MFRQSARRTIRIAAVATGFRLSLGQGADRLMIASNRDPALRRDAAASGTP